ncbi:PQQ-binding-like beta-propeller repeat protein [Spirillospora sp. CA-255316]
MVGGRRPPREGTGASGRGRLALGVLSGVLVVTVVAVMAGRFVLQAEWWQVRHSVTAAPVVPQAALGPPPGPLAVSWQRSAQVRRGTLAGHGSVAHELAQGQVVTASGRGLEVRDARTGTERWSYRRTGWTLLGWSTTRSRLVGYFERTGHRGERQTVGFDALSGGVMWRRAGAERPAAATRATLRWPGGSGVVLTTDKHRRTLYGRSADDGGKRWTRELPPGCRLFEDASHASDGVEALSVLALDCEGRSRLVAVEPSGGRVRWIRSLGSQESPDVRVLDGVTLAFDGTALRAYDEDGSQKRVWNGDEVCGDAMCPAVVVEGRLIVAYGGAGRDGGRLESVDVSSGRSQWTRDVPGYAAVTEAGGRVYALRPRLDERLLPAGVDVVDPSDGTATTVPAPFAMDPALTGVRPWLAAAGGLLYAAVPEAAPRPTGSARLVALRGGFAGPGPAELGGVAEADWPDACGLLKAPDLAGAHLDGEYTTKPGRARFGDVRLPRPVTCTYEIEGADLIEQRADPDERDRDLPEEPVPSASPGSPVPSATGSLRPGSPRPGTSGGPVPSERERPGDPGDSGDSGSAKPRTSAGPRDTARPDGRESQWGKRGLTVTVKWVAPTAPTASALLQTLQATQSQARRRTDIGGDEAYEIGPTAGTIALRVDRYIVMVDASQPSGAATRLARAIAGRLPHTR